MQQLVKAFSGLFFSNNKFAPGWYELADEVNSQFSASFNGLIGRRAENLIRRRRRLKGIHSRLDTNRTWAEGLSFTTPDCCTAWIRCCSYVIKPASSFVIQNRQTSCSMWCPMYRARC